MTIAKNFRSTDHYKAALKEIMGQVRSGKDPHRIDFKTGDKYWAAALHEARRRWDKREHG
ncbi:hypothetical protein BST95_06660 [Halioglobus japonicus]|uniref:Uncharacterized protein n=1 Tax=Halioglobus japonicus TaxID=930805 RepID=A0AAP8MAW2_9GAMM|nr:hypothetical protein [Halioglobus japonicus]AQA17288.1 hypothetical protein BST95_02660 [Halioglobus japonicus]AQA17966.1 hypothetical protein BST95_06660 [Halioglobus japonicus]PLW84493.1 hypothetical protein C0029_18945 [Halioglobus japonicus]